MSEKDFGSAQARTAEPEVERAVDLLGAGPRVVGTARTPGSNHIILTLSFKGCDDDAFSIEADLSTVGFWFPHLAGGGAS